MGNIRLERLLNRNEHVVIIAVDHGEFDGPIAGMIDLPETISKIDSSVDGILLSPGMLPHSTGRAALLERLWQSTNHQEAYR